jgi:hypothetical protein
MAKRVRMSDQAARGAGWRQRYIDDPGIPAPNVYSLPAAFRVRATGEVGR